MSATTDGLIVWGVGTPRTLRVHWVLHELGLAYSTRAIQSRTGETQTEEFTHLNRRQKIPVLQDSELTLTESAAIIAYLAERYAHDDAQLIPASSSERAHCLEWCFFALSELDATTLYVLRRHEGLPQIYGEAPMANAAARTYFRKQMRSVEHALADGRAFLVGSQFSVADIMLCSCLTWASACGIPLADTALAYSKQLTSRPAYRQANAANALPGNT